MHLLYENDNGRLALKQVLDSKAKKYAILSHRWRDDEVSFQDMKQPGFEQKAGYRKMYMCMQQARSDGVKYCWVDTCCINKESSAELQEAINSMWTWYQDAKVCYAFLDDVTASWVPGAHLEIPDIRDPFDKHYSKTTLTDASIRTLCTSTWFSRGWTLQELLAPSRVWFFDQYWEFMGTKRVLRHHLHHFTKIPESCLDDPRVNERWSFASHVSWIAGRITTRPEDMAYCLMGLLDVNMPLLYGEGHKAFRRLQEEFIRVSPDVSVLYWQWPLVPGQGFDRRDLDSILASTAALFPPESDVVSSTLHLSPPDSRAGHKNNVVSLVLSSALLEISGTQVFRFSNSGLCLAFLESYSSGWVRDDPSHASCLLLRFMEDCHNTPYTLDFGYRFLKVETRSLGTLERLFPVRDQTIRIMRRCPRYLFRDVTYWSIEFNVRGSPLTQEAACWPNRWQRRSKNCFECLSESSELILFAGSVPSSFSPHGGPFVALAVDSEQPSRPVLSVGWQSPEKSIDDAVLKLVTESILPSETANDRHAGGEAIITVGSERLRIFVRYDGASRDHSGETCYTRYIIEIDEYVESGRDSSIPRLNLSHLGNDSQKLKREG